MQNVTSCNIADKYLKYIQKHSFSASGHFSCLSGGPCLVDIALS